MAASVATPLVNELDVMLQDLSKGHYESASNGNDYSVYSDFESFTKGSTPNRPPPPRSYKATVSVRSEASSNMGHSSKMLRRPPKPPKLQHVLTSGKSHDLVKATPR